MKFDEAPDFDVLISEASSELAKFTGEIGMYKVTEDYANKCAAATKLPEPEADPTTVANAINLNDNTITNKAFTPCAST